MLDLYLSQLQQAYTTLNVPLLTSLLSPSPTSQTFIQLRQSLLSSPQTRTSKNFLDSTRSKFPQPQARPFADYVSNHLVYVRDTPIPEARTKDGLERCFTLLEDLYKTADRLFATSENGFFVPTLRILTNRLISIALLHGRVTGDAKLTKAGESARMLARPMGIAASDRSPTTGNESVPPKKSALYFLANCTFRVYFALHNLRLCDTVLNNVNNSNVSLEKDKGLFGKGDRSEFWYYRGRIGLYQRRLRAAKADLEKSFGECRVGAGGGKNSRLIMVYLITASIPLGYFPRLEVLQEFNLVEQFGPSLLEPLRKGNWRLVSAQLERNRDWHLNHGNFLLLREKLEVVCWRNLARQTLLVSTNGQPLPTTGPPTLSLSLLLKAARVAWNTGLGEEVEEVLDEDDIESVMVSLMDQGYLKAYIMHSKRLLVLQKGKHFGFPPLTTVG
ncbi:uncharacterized protein JCM6883_000538 [Sporobolomyces salmoneus]|uniref:uncharacterized protein n=1 Tax=Sporobolomyces salmoneus TaxID=183962 RepID=UPI003178729D